MIRVVFYARFSSDLQNNASIEDQIRLCREFAQKEGWDVMMVYSDYAMSGASMNREGMQALMRDAADRQFDVVLTEGLDRLSRDQENIAGIYKRLTFSDIKIYSLSDGGYISDIHIGLKGTMNQLYLKDLALKTKRGQRGRIEKGKVAAGGAAFGYNVVKRFDANGEPVRGERTINQEQAIIVRRIFEEYASGKSPRLIAMDLNKEGILNSRGNPWSPQGIIGARSVAAGLINNEMYIGKLVWNKRNFVRHPETGKPVGRITPIDERVTHDLPELRIIDQALWDKAKEKQKSIGTNRKPHTMRRPKALFSYLIECSCCGGGFAKISMYRYGCTAARKKGTCDNRITIDQKKLEQTILSGLQYRLMQPDLFAAFCDAYTKQMEDLKKHYHSDVEQAKSKIVKLDNEKAKLIEAIKQGIPADEIKDEFARIKVSREQAEKAIMDTSRPTLSINPDMATHYQEEVQKLRETLHDDEHRHEAVSLIRSLVHKIVLSPDKDNKKLNVNVYGELAGILYVASKGEFTEGRALLETFNDSTSNLFETDHDKKQVMNDYRAITCWLKLRSSGQRVIVRLSFLLANDGWLITENDNPVHFHYSGFTSI